MFGGAKALQFQARGFSQGAQEAAAAATNETALVHELEKHLERACRDLRLPYVRYRLEQRLRPEGSPRFVDVAHGGVVIEYEAPRQFGGRDGAAVQHARHQAEEYSQLLSIEEGRPLWEYALVVWDGGHVSFGQWNREPSATSWKRLRPFDASAAAVLLQHMHAKGVPLVSPRLLTELVGPETDLGTELIPRFFDAVLVADDGPPTKTTLLYREWRRLFGQAVGVQSEQLRALLNRQSQVHNRRYGDQAAPYLFALNSYIALIAKFVAALSLQDAPQDLSEATVPIADRIEALEAGQFFVNAGIVNMLSGDFFSWYADDPHWPTFAQPIERIVDRLGHISFDVAKKTPESTRDLFKGMYETFVPRALRHALGEFYTPDWLAAHALDALRWKPHDDLLDPTCGSGTFLLEALKRRLTSGRKRSASELLKGLYGLDLNPLAVLAARASLVVFLSKHFTPERPIRIPVYLADSINPVSKSGGIYSDSLQTEQGILHFHLPADVVEHTEFPALMSRCRELIEAPRNRAEVVATLLSEYTFLSEAEHGRLINETVDSLIEMRTRRWVGLWTSMLAERFGAGSIPPVNTICGNPPWVKWSHLPPEYADFIKARCLQLGVFSQDRWVGGIESDISTVITFEVVSKWLADGGRLAFFITGTVFSNESSQGFRRFRLNHAPIFLAVERVEDFTAVRPFEGVTNVPTLLLLTRGRSTVYPVPYWVWEPPSQSSPAGQMLKHPPTKLLAAPVPGTDSGPWLRGTEPQHEAWSKVFGNALPYYKARKGVTTDLNGAFFVRVLKVEGARAEVVNDPDMGRKALPKVKAWVESEHVFPLVRGRGVEAYQCTADPEFCVLLPQRGMHGDTDLAVSSPLTYRYLKRFEGALAVRGSYRRFQRGKPVWSVWNTGTYTFAEYKVFWREMGGGRFAAAYGTPKSVAGLPSKPAIPDHKLYFVPCESEEEAAYICGFLNAPTVSEAIAAYASQLSLGVSVVEYLNLPGFDPRDSSHAEISATAIRTQKRGNISQAEGTQLDQRVRAVLGL